MSITVRDLLNRPPVARSVFDLPRIQQWYDQRKVVLDRVKPVVRKRRGCSNRDVPLYMLAPAQARAVAVLIQLAEVH